MSTPTRDAAERGHTAECPNYVTSTRRSDFFSPTPTPGYSDTPTRFVPYRRGGTAGRSIPVRPRTFTNRVIHVWAFQ